MTVMGAALLTRALPRIGDTPVAAQREISAPKLKADALPRIGDTPVAARLFFRK